MEEPLYVSRVSLDKVGSLHRRAHLPLGTTAEMGVHGAIVPFYRLSPERELPLPVDYIVAATGG
jgi:hypothetical protein